MGLASIGIGAFATFGSLYWMPEVPLTKAVLSGGMAGSLVFGGVYLLRRVAVSLPTIASGIAEYRQQTALAAKTLEAVEAYTQPARRDTVPVSPADLVDVGGLWRVELRRFLVAGKLAGTFSLRVMVARQYVSDSGHRRLSGVLTGAGMLAASKAGTVYAPGWGHARAWRLVADIRAVPHGRPPHVTL